MESKDQSQAESTPPVEKKREYNSPRLTVYGHMSKLTAAGTTGAPESNGDDGDSMP